MLNICKKVLQNYFKQKLMYSILFTFISSPLMSSTVLCKDLLAKSESEEIKLSNLIQQMNAPSGGKKIFKIQFKDDHTYRELEFSKIVLDSNGKKIEFVGKWNDRDVVYRVSVDEIINWSKLDEKNIIDMQSQKDSSAMENISFALLVSLKMEELMFYPFKKLRKFNSSIEVVGQKSVSQELGVLTAERLDSFDQLLESMGFKKPEKTRIIVSGPSPLPHMMGPVSINIPIFNLWSNRLYDNTIAMNPFNGNFNAIKDESILYHERTHTFLHRTYTDESFILNNKVIEESIADFATTFKTESPMIGLIFGDNEKTAFRNINDKTTNYEINKPEKLDSLFLNKDIDTHRNSLLFSNALWNLRQKIGSERVKNNFKQFIDNLNNYYDSYNRILKMEDRTSDSVNQQLVYDFEYFLAVIHKSYSHPALVNHVNKFIKEATEAQGLSYTRILDLSHRLSLSEKSYLRNSKTQMKLAMKAAALGTTSLIVQSALIYWVLDSDD